MSKTMDFGNLLNHNIKVERHLENIFNKECEIIKLVNTTNNMVLAEFTSANPITTWINPGGFMSKKQYDENIQKLMEKQESRTVNVG